MRQDAVHAVKSTYRQTQAALFDQMSSRCGTLVTPPIFVCGHARSGTSWIAATLAQTPGTVHYHEPVDGRYWGWTEQPEQTGYFRLEAGEPNGYFSSALDAPFAGRWSPSLRTPARQVWRGARRPLVKDVWSAICPRWIIERYAPVTVAVYRSPYAVVASQLERGIDSVHGINALRAQIASEHYVPSATTSLSEVQRVTLLWAITTKLMVEDLKRCENVIPVSFRDLATAPEAGFVALAEQLDLAPSKELKNWVAVTTQKHEAGRYAVSRKSSERIEGWRESLSAKQVAEITAVVRDFDLPDSAVAG